ncbi:hypothetical protein I4U23_002314 [Adineta vaga]|nr:hypothetical protein I4U23_002314 [Adineta vaga]
MADQPPPQRPKGPRMSHLHSEPVPMSFASPQQLANIVAGGSLFSQQPMHTQHQTYTPRMNAPHHMNMGHQPMYRMQTAPGVIMPDMTVVPTGVATTEPQAATSNERIFKSLAAQEIDLNNFTGFRFVTLDGLQDQTRDIYDKISGTIRWVMCEGQDDRCLDVIQNECKDKRVFLITSGSIGSNIVPKIHELPQIYAIYVYCSDVNRHQEWAKNFSKVRIVCNDDDEELLPQFAVDVARANMDWADALQKKGDHEKAKEKYQLALNKLNNHARKHDPAMDAEIQTKLQQCK